jgi:hypothetical protein
MFLFFFAGFPEIGKNEGTIVPKTNFKKWWTRFSLVKWLERLTANTNVTTVWFPFQLASAQWNQGAIDEAVLKKAL